MFVRSLAIGSAATAIGFMMAIVYGPGQSFGAVVSFFLLLVVIRKDCDPVARWIFAFLSVCVLCLTLLSTHTAYQYTRRNTDRIVEAGCQLMPQHSQIDLDGKIQPDDPCVPEILRELGADSILVSENRVVVHVSGIRTLLYVPGHHAELHIFRKPATTIASIWVDDRGGKGAGRWKITDQLWMMVDD